MRNFEENEKMTTSIRLTIVNRESLYSMFSPEKARSKSDKLRADENKIEFERQVDSLYT